MKSLLFIAIIALFLFSDVLLRKKKKKSNKNYRKKSKITKRKHKKSFENHLPPPPEYPNYGSLAMPDYPGLTTPLTTGTYSSAGNLYQARPGDSIPYGTGYSYGNWEPIEMN